MVGQNDRKNTVISDIALYPGNSGGPLVNADCQVVGLSIATFQPARSISVPSATVKTVIDQIVKEGRVRRAYLGIAGQPTPLASRLAQKASVTQESGIMLFSVEDDSPAEKAGLSVGDILVQLDEETVENLNDLHRLLTSDLINKTVEVHVIRGGQKLQLSLSPRTQPALAPSTNHRSKNPLADSTRVQNHLDPHSSFR